MSCSRNRNGFTSRPVSIELISKYRTELMGIAMLLVILFHGYVPQTSWFYGLKRILVALVFGSHGIVVPTLNTSTSNAFCVFIPLGCYWLRAFMAFISTTKAVLVRMCSTS